MGWGFRGRAPKWLFCSGRVAFYYRNAGSLRTERWLFSRGLRNCRLVAVTAVADCRLGARQLYGRRRH